MIEIKIHKWSRNEERFLINNYKTMSNREMSRKLNIKQKSVANKIFNLHLKREKTASGNMIHKWVREEEQFLIDNYKTMSNKELSRRLGIKQKSVANKVFNLHLKREKKVRETLIEHIPVDGKYKNLKGKLFGLICDGHIKQKYSGMLILSSRMATNEKRIGISNASSIGFVCEDTKTLQRMAKALPQLHYFYSYRRRGYSDYFRLVHDICDFSSDIIVNEQKALIKILKRGDKKKEKEFWKRWDEMKIYKEVKGRIKGVWGYEDEMEGKKPKILENAKKYAKFVAAHKLTALPDYIVFLENEIHIYEFKAGKKIKLTRLQKEAFKKLKNSDLNIKIFVLRPTEHFPPNVDITVGKY